MLSAAPNLITPRNPRGRIVVVGGINMDLFIEADRFPRPGETFEGNHFSTGGGGKGANQAVAAARISGRPGAVEMIGQVGDDIFGRELVQTMERYGVGCRYVRRAKGQASGVALIFSDATKQNHVLPVYGANATCGDRQLADASRALKSASVLLVQQEISIDLTRRCMAKAREEGVLVVLDPAPVRTLPEGFLELADILHPNQVEAQELTGIEVTGPEGAASAAKAVRRPGVKVAIVKLGEQGCFVDSDDFTGHVPGFKVPVVATVAAGDAFAGGLAVALAEGRPLREAVLMANAAGALCVSKPGAQDSMPSRAEVVELLNHGTPGKARERSRARRPGSPGPS
ncbi:MAG: ribokinase [Chloroflexi bacterium]|nr:ribokinase [Chloroflexota bacterium]